MEERGAITKKGGVLTSTLLADVAAISRRNQSTVSSRLGSSVSSSNNNIDNNEDSQNILTDGSEGIDQEGVATARVDNNEKRNDSSGNNKLNQFMLRTSQLFDVLLSEMTQSCNDSGSGDRSSSDTNKQQKGEGSIFKNTVVVLGSSGGSEGQGEEKNESSRERKFSVS